MEVSSTYSSPRHYVEMSDQLYALVALHPRKVPFVPAEYEVLWERSRESNPGFSVIQLVS